MFSSYHSTISDADNSLQALPSPRIKLIGLKHIDLPREKLEPPEDLHRPVETDMVRTLLELVVNEPVVLVRGTPATGTAWAMEC